jgi:hypothetical protein
MCKGSTGDALSKTAEKSKLQGERQMCPKANHGGHCQIRTKKQNKTHLPITEVWQVSGIVPCIVFGGTVLTSKTILVELLWSRFQHQGFDAKPVAYDMAIRHPGDVKEAIDYTSLEFRSAPVQRQEPSVVYV